MSISSNSASTDSDSPKLSVRFADNKFYPSDPATILDFIKRLAEYEKLAHEVVADVSSIEATLFPKNGTPSAEVLIASLDERPVGFALFFPNYSTFLARSGIHLEDLFVLPEERGKGIGEALLNAVAKVALDRKAGRLEWAVLDWNEPAIQFYRKKGAVPMNEWTTFRLSGQALIDTQQR